MLVLVALALRQVVFQAFPAGLDGGHFLVLEFF